MKTRLCLALALLLGAAVCFGADPVFDVKALTATPLNARTLKTTEKAGIVTEEVVFHSEMDGDKSVDIFAFFSYPKGPRALPAFVWNQGGLGRANTWWTEFGARRGYATLCIDFPLPGYRSTGGYHINSGLELTPDPRKAPIYHGAVALLKAVSFLESRPEVDKSRIGMAGSSWGGFYTTFMIGIDTRLKVGSCFFGCGAMQLGNAWWDGAGRNTALDAAFRERWRATLDPATRLAGRKTPIAWFSGTDDHFYWMPALMESYRLAAGPRHLSLLPNWNHGLTPNLDEQVFVWLDAHLKGAPAFIKVTPLKVARQGKRLVATWTFSGPRKVTGADLILSFGAPGNWSSRYWKTLKAEIRGDRCSVELPVGPMEYFISGTAIDKDTFRYSTPIVHVDPRALGILDPAAALDYDGCALWGGFEPRQVWYLKANALMQPVVSKDAHEGRQSVVLKGGITRLHQIRFTAGVPHVFRCYLKSAEPVEVAVTLSGSFDRQRIDKTVTVKVGDKWTSVTIDFQPPRALAAAMTAVIKLPKGRGVLLDSVSFRPVHEPK